VRRGLPAVAIVGRPNVGKSTFFNRIIGERLAIVEDVPGVTRDRNFALAEWAGRRFYMIDTGGLDTDTDDPMAVAVREQVLAAFDEADLIVFIVDGKVGPAPVDYRIAELLRKSEIPVLLVVNKVDRIPVDLAHHEFWEMGLGEPMPVSSISGKGSGDILDAVITRLPAVPVEPDNENDLYIAVIGKPNVGKSSFVNRLLGEERMLVSDVPGTTRDSIDTPYLYHGKNLVFIDTAGLRRQARIQPGLEYYSALRSERSIERADVCLLLIDATEEPHVQDLKIAEKAWHAGRSLIIVANKWDLVEKDTNTAKEYVAKMRERAPSLRWVPVVFTSALTGQRVHNVLDQVLEVAEERNKRISTHEVTEVVRELSVKQPPPHYRGMPVKFLYATQADTSPPTFVLFANYPKAIEEGYTRYIQNQLREHWPFQGTPIRLRLRGRREEK
jgi:GTP-binding protein